MAEGLETKETLARGITLFQCQNFHNRSNVAPKERWQIMNVRACRTDLHLSQRSLYE
jgi:hypothetical protein